MQVRRGARSILCRPNQSASTYRRRGRRAACRQCRRGCGCPAPASALPNTGPTGSKVGGGDVEKEKMAERTGSFPTPKRPGTANATVPERRRPASPRRRGRPGAAGRRPTGCCPAWPGTLDAWPRFPRRDEGGVRRSDALKKNTARPLRPTLMSATGMVSVLHEV